MLRSTKQWLQEEGFIRGGDDKGRGQLQLTAKALTAMNATPQGLSDLVFLPKGDCLRYPIPTEEMRFASYRHDWQLMLRGKFMKKVKSEMTDELRPEYKRSDFGEIVRGKYANRIKEETNVVLLEPDIAQAFPNDEAVNKALRYLLEVAKTSTSLTQRSSGLH